MKNSLRSFVIVALSIIVFISCGNKSVPDAYIGKWDMTNDSIVQKVIEIKEGSVFVETWTVYDDDGNPYGEVEIQGKCEFLSTADFGGTAHALCLIYDLESLSDPDGILEAYDKDYFKNENESYESAKRKGQVYGFQNAHMEGSTLFFEGGQWKLIDEE